MLCTSKFNEFRVIVTLLKWLHLNGTVIEQCFSKPWTKGAYSLSDHLHKRKINVRYYMVHTPLNMLQTNCKLRPLCSVILIIMHKADLTLFNYLLREMQVMSKSSHYCNVLKSSFIWMIKYRLRKKRTVAYRRIPFCDSSIYYLIVNFSLLVIKVSEADHNTIKT